MRIAKSIVTFCAAAAFAAATAFASPAFATNNNQGGVRTQSDLENSGWYCMQASDAHYYYVCTKPFEPTYQCHLGVCSPDPIRQGSRVVRTPNGTVTATATTMTPQTSTTTTSTATATARSGH